ncbi:multicopper oxidase family protein [Budviciaceae bacterium BWR-B9]|uniref:Multicopper oxidase family protein n=1 Tax=Limnobaculum allomyrinae TaxID=2791986 RepID=A0ABS1IN42_9GAMM|nr:MULTISPECIES: multicopper oxidase family protein [Limnobaculum]MBK5143174.1 multicopper oxidase family protein [Limnobaculum allomyrinae]
MNRRLFLTKLAAAVGTLAAAKVVAQPHHMEKMPSGHNMENMSHHNMGNMSMGEMHNSKLLPESALPKNLPLPDLKKLLNTSDKSGYFSASLTAKPVRVQLTPQVETEFWAYNDQIPGPAIEVFEGDTVEILFKNELPQPTTVHWHGLPVPPDQDGNPQDEVAPGASRVYKFTLPEGCAGTYWYHPHGHNTVAEQAFRGLAGVFIVKPKQDQLAHIPVQNWLISDLKLSADGQIAPNSMMDWMNGREGQFVLINGASHPEITLNQATRARLWNACSGRYLNLSLNDADIYLIGTDGGLLEQPYKLTTLLLTPGERAEILIVPKKSGTQSLQALAYDRGKMGCTTEEVTRSLASINLKASQLPDLPTKLASLPNIGKASAVKTLEYTETMDMGKGMSGMNFLINGKKHDPKRIDLTSKVGEVEEWEIFNNSHMDHNFHLHGTQFTVVSYQLNGQSRLPEYIGHKDTINLKPYERVRIKLVQQHKGLRMYHCHILEHETLGMMGQLNVI